MAVNNQSRYQYGSAAYDYDVRRQMQEPYEVPQHKTGSRRKPAAAPARGLNFAGILLVMSAFAICAMVMVHYVKLQSTLTGTIKSVANKQVTLTELQSRNDATYARTTSSVDLSEIEAVAREELGMSYAEEGQIITYSSAGNDYMRKVDSDE